MAVRTLLDPASGALSYLVTDTTAKAAVLIDPVLECVDRDQRLLEELDVELIATLETHAQDRRTGGAVLANRLGSTIVASKTSTAQHVHRYVDDGDRITIGRHTLVVRATPGHTAGATSYVMDGVVFTGALLGVRRVATASGPGGVVAELYHSIRDRLFTLPDDMVVYPARGTDGILTTTIGEERRFNPSVGGDTTLAAFAALDNASDPSSSRPATTDHNGRSGFDPATWAPLARTAAEVPEVAAAWVAENLTTVTVVDVRQEEEREGPDGCIEAARHIPISRLKTKTIDWPKDQAVVLVCQTGARSGRGAIMLEGLGFLRVASLAGGMQRWNRLGLPTIELEAW